MAELLRKRGRDLIASQNFELFQAEKMRNEVQYELEKRISIMVNKTSLTQALGKLQLEAAFRLIDSKIATFSLPFYQAFEEEARKRIPRDPNDWEAVALALALPAAIWTEDYDFFGCGCSTWTTHFHVLNT